MIKKRDINKMKIKTLILTIPVLFSFSFINAYSQENVAGTDTTRQKKTEVVTVKKEQNQEQVQSRVQERNQVQGAENAGQKAKPQGQNTGKQVKQVTSARPDMSKARGARPPQITRPSGPPKGIGKPGGAPGRGGR
ncbi:MAG: hypothetical protein WBJ37_01050 [Bacteroidales bacterium]